MFASLSCCVEREKDEAPGATQPHVVKTHSILSEASSDEQNTAPVGNVALNSASDLAKREAKGAKEGAIGAAAWIAEVVGASETAEAWTGMAIGDEVLSPCSGRPSFTRQQFVRTKSGDETQPMVDSARSA
eukprot:gb/GFBE01063702.1/.p1 GENE.gb/GFBE01063702.1/~~gb/GFBE01063702.1/.p1  ORF type:complete len:131 (+),score=20.77 gb/GFBE01063702.1/:1-393(+)